MRYFKMDHEHCKKWLFQVGVHNFKMGHHILTTLFKLSNDKSYKIIISISLSYFAATVFFFVNAFTYNSPLLNLAGRTAY